MDVTDHVVAEDLPRRDNVRARATQILHRRKVVVLIQATNQPLLRKMVPNFVVPLHETPERKRYGKNKNRKLLHKGLKLRANVMLGLKDVELMVSKSKLPLCRALTLTCS